jgi:hypothetical protein
MLKSRKSPTTVEQDPEIINNTPAEQTQPQNNVSTTPQGGAVGEYTGGPMKLGELNPNLGLDDEGGDSRSRVVADGTELVYKALDGLRVTELIIPGTDILKGMKYHQWWPAKNDQGEQIEEGGMCMSIDNHKTSVDGLICATCPKFKKCKMKYDLTFQEWDEMESTMREHVLACSTTSGIAFIDYAKALAKGEVASKDDMAYLRSARDPRKAVSFGPNGNNNGWYVHPERGEFKGTPNQPLSLADVVTRVTVRRVTKTIEGKPITWSQFVFQAIGLVSEMANADGDVQVG